MCRCVRAERVLPQNLPEAAFFGNGPGAAQGRKGGNAQIAHFLPAHLARADLSGGPSACLPLNSCRQQRYHMHARGQQNKRREEAEQKAT